MSCNSRPEEYGLLNGTRINAPSCLKDPALGKPPNERGDRNQRGATEQERRAAVRPPNHTAPA